MTDLQGTSKLAGAEKYLYGRGVPQDIPRALELYRLAAAEGDSEAMCKIGNIYGGSFMFDKEMQYHWYWQAARAGDVLGMLNVWKRLKEGIRHIYDKDEDQAKFWGARAFAAAQHGVEEGCTKALGPLGFCYKNGVGVSKDAAMAVEWFRRGAEAGHARAMNDLGNCYRQGVGVAKDAAMAVEWFRRGAEAGDAGAMLNLGNCYGKGVGVAKDAAMAVEWCRRGAEAGHAEAMGILGNCYRDGVGVAKDAAMAVEWYRRGAEAGCGRAMSSLGICYGEGVGVAKDIEIALEWFRRADEAGNASGMHNVPSVRRLMNEREEPERRRRLLVMQRFVLLCAARGDANCVNTFGSLPVELLGMIAHLDPTDPNKGWGCLLQ